MIECKKKKSIIHEGTFFYSVKYEKKQVILYKMWEVEQNEVQLALNNIADDLESLKNMNANVEEAIYNRKYIKKSELTKTFSIITFVINIPYRLDVESKLLAVLTKYDTEIGNRYRTLEELNRIYENDKLEKLAVEVSSCLLYIVCGDSCVTVKALYAHIMFCNCYKTNVNI